MTAWGHQHSTPESASSMSAWWTSARTWATEVGRPQRGRRGVRPLGEPVGSETIAEASGWACRAPRSATRWRPSRSSGTDHPHTSAGRIPTDHGYRHYVDTMPHGVRLRDAHRRAIAGFFAEAILDLEEVLKGSVQPQPAHPVRGLAVPPARPRSRSCASS